MLLLSHTLPWEKKIKRVRGVEQTNKITFAQYVRRALCHAGFSRNEDASRTVEVPVLPGCITGGINDKNRGCGDGEGCNNRSMDNYGASLRFGDEIPVIDGCYLQYAIDEIK